MSEPEPSLRTSVEKGFKWSAAERILNQGLTFVIQILLARILGPEEFGPLAIAIIFLHLTDIFVDSGLGHALVQAKKIEKVDIATVFYANLGISLVCYAILWFCAPLIADFYDKPIVSPVSRWVFLNLVLTAFGRCQMSLLTREMKFKKLFYVSTPAIIISGVISVVMALNGFGVWSLVVQIVIKASLSSVLLWVFTDPQHIPGFQFSFESLKRLGSFGFYLLGAHMLHKGSQHFYGLVVGKAFSVEQLALYNRANGFQRTPTGVLSQVFGRVLFPAFSRIQDDDAKIRRALQRGLPVLSFVVTPAMVLLMATAEPFILTILSEKWRTSADYLAIFPIVGMLFPISSIGLTVIRSKGNSRFVLMLSITKNAMAIGLLCLTVQYGVMAIVIGQAVVAVVGQFINATALKHSIGYQYKDQFTNFAPYIFVGLACGALVWPFKYFALVAPVILLIQVIVFSVAYLLICKLFNLQGYVELKQRYLKRKPKAETKETID